MIKIIDVNRSKKNENFSSGYRVQTIVDEINDQLGNKLDAQIYDSKAISITARNNRVVDYETSVFKIIDNFTQVIEQDNDFRSNRIIYYLK